MSEEINEVKDNEVEKGVHNYSAEDQYVKPDNPVILDRLEWFKDQKLGLMMHWGPYSQIGLVESWALSDDDADWSRTGVDWEDDGEEFKRQYFDLNKTFNPIRFEPEKWADLAKESGFKYLVFTTKHHDGFCMWDTQYTDYKITGPDCPFHTNKNADICKNVFDAFRNRGIAIAAYFSKADWHTPYYWAPGMSRGRNMWRGPSYDTREYPWLWEKFVEFTHNQILELLTKYGRIDVLWLDAGWVCPQSGMPQDIRLGEVVEKAREKQPWLLSADRTVGGPYENYITPEQTIPDKPILVPWESNITMGTSFSFKYEDKYKSTRQLIHLLIEVVSKGGNLIMNVGPQPDGRLPEGAIRCMKGIGKWLEEYGESIYGTRACAPYFTEKCAFVSKNDNVYCFYLYKDETEKVNKEITIPYDKKVNCIELVGTNEKLNFKQENNDLIIQLPDSQVTEKAPIAHVFKFN